MPNIRWLLALITAIHRWVYLESGGRLGHRLLGKPMLLLDTVGRRSGRRFVTPLLYAEDGSGFVVAASNMGDRRLPGWWHNLEAQPDATVQVATRRISVRARRADAEEERRLWPALERYWPSYAAYRERAGREIPVVVLEPRSG